MVSTFMSAAPAKPPMVIVCLSARVMALDSVVDYGINLLTGKNEITEAGR
jgi:hypothetical protein